MYLHMYMCLCICAYVYVHMYMCICTYMYTCKLIDIALLRPWSGTSSYAKDRCDPNMTSSEGMARVCKLLVEKGADPNAQNSRGL